MKPTKKSVYLATGRRPESNEKIKIILILLNDFPNSKIFEWIKISRLPNHRFMNGKIKSKTM